MINRVFQRIHTFLPAWCGGGLSTRGIRRLITRSFSNSRVLHWPMYRIHRVLASRHAVLDNSNANSSISRKFMESSQNTRRSRSRGPIYLPRVVEFNREWKRKLTNWLRTRCIIFVILRNEIISLIIFVHRKIKKDRKMF